MQSSTARPLTGFTSCPGDKSISHRALILSSQRIGITEINGILEGDDVLNTAKALGLFGVNVTRNSAHHWQVSGVGIGGLAEASDILDMGNSGTGARLMMGLLASYPFASFFTGDASLRKRPMKRVMTPLEQMGARFEARDGGRLPLMMRGASQPLPIEYTLPMASAQVKSAILLAALNTAGATTVIEPKATRDHTERMLRHMGWQVETRKLPQGQIAITLSGHQKVPHGPLGITVPADPSSAAFLAVAALIVPGSEITISNVCVNPLRVGLYITLKEMGANLTFVNERISAGEEVADIKIKHSKLTAVLVPEDRAPSMIDEYPILAIAAAFAQGTTAMHGLGELKVKESDRLSAIAHGLKQCGVTAEVNGDSLSVTGSPQPVGGAIVPTHFDHRIAMSFLVLGMASRNPVHIDDGSAITTSFPGFTELMNGLGARIAADTPSPKRTIPVRSLVVAIDGPAASGKGTLARRLAEYLGYPYLDTGSIYRAVGLKLIYSDKDPNDTQAAIAAARSLNAQDLVNPRLRQERIGKAASIISAVPKVRSILLDFQRNFAQNPKGAVLDGRDIGTVVCPDADVKIFITASLETRARRRHRELQGEGIEVVYESVLEDLFERDERDARRSVAPLIPAADAFVIDTSHLDAGAVFTQVVAIINGRLAESNLAQKQINQ
jgi:3-phosphoshikimate 1-carboxyvinyltransferase